MGMPLYHILEEYRRSGPYPFHMPGHKNGRGLDLGNVLSFDITEIPGFDDLHNAQGVIGDAQKQWAELCGADESFFLVNGASCGIMAAIMSCCGEHEKLILARNAHKSAYGGLIFSGGLPIFVSPEIIPEYQLQGAVLPEKIKQAIKEHPEAKAVFITSPTYEGFLSDIKAIAEIVHENQMLLIVDEAHGAHLKFCPGFPKPALDMGADIVIQSTHKTLTSMTQTALLHVKGSGVDRNKLQMCLRLLQSSSPSYVLMASLDKTKEIILSGETILHTYTKRIQELRSHFAGMEKIKLAGNEMKKEFYAYDPGKLVFYSKYMTGMELAETLRNQYHLQMEFWGPNHVLAMTSFADSEEGFCRLEEAIREMDFQCVKDVKTQWIPRLFPAPKLHCTPREAAFAPKRTIPLKKSVHEVSGEFIIPYPPGIPLLAPGEIITEEILTLVQYYLDRGIAVTGMADQASKTITIL